MQKSTELFARFYLTEYIQSDVQDGSVFFGGEGRDAMPQGKGLMYKHTVLK